MLPIQDQFQDYVDATLAKGDRHPVIKMPTNLQTGFYVTVRWPTEGLTIETPDGCKIISAKTEKP